MISHTRNEGEVELHTAGSFRVSHCAENVHSGPGFGLDHHRVKAHFLKFTLGITVTNRTWELTREVWKVNLFVL